MAHVTGRRHPGKWLNSMQKQLLSKEGEDGEARPGIRREHQILQFTCERATLESNIDRLVNENGYELVSVQMLPSKEALSNRFEWIVAVRRPKRF